MFTEVVNFANNNIKDVFIFLNPDLSYGQGYNNSIFEYDVKDRLEIPRIKRVYNHCIIISNVVFERVITDEDIKPQLSSFFRNLGIRSIYKGDYSIESINDFINKSSVEEDLKLYNMVNLISSKTIIKFLVELSQKVHINVLMFYLLKIIQNKHITISNLEEKLLNLDQSKSDLEKVYNLYKLTI